MVASSSVYLGSLLHTSLNLGRRNHSIVIRSIDMNVVVIVRLIEIYTPLYIEIHHISILVHVPIPLTRTLSSGRPPRRSGPMDAASPIMLIIPFMKIALHLTCLTSSALRNRRPSSHFSSDPMPHFTLDSSKRMLFTNSD
jgi:hypothetical protein